MSCSYRNFPGVLIGGDALPGSDSVSEPLPLFFCGLDFTGVLLFPALRIFWTVLAFLGLRAAFLGGIPACPELTTTVRVPVNNVSEARFAKVTGREVHVATSVGQNFKQLLDDQSAIFGKKRKLKTLRHRTSWCGPLEIGMR